MVDDNFEYTTKPPVEQRQISVLAKKILVMAGVLLAVIFIIYKQAIQRTGSNAVASVSTTLLPVNAAAPLDFSNEQKDQLRGLIKEYIENNPELLVTALDKIRANISTTAKSVQNHKLLDKADDIKRIENLGYSFLGNRDGDIKIIFFLDYTCDFCRQANQIVQQLIDTDTNIKVVIQYISISPASSPIAPIVFAAAQLKQEIFASLHGYLMSAELTTLTESSVMQYVTTKKGIPEKSLLPARDGVRDSVKGMVDLLRYIDAKGVPAFIINGQLYSGLLKLEQLQDIITNIRASKQH